MFPRSYFLAAYFTPGYFGPVDADEVTEPTTPTDARVDPIMAGPWKRDEGIERAVIVRGD